MRSLYVVKDIKKGEIINKDSIRSVRPGFGIPPKYLKEIIGKKATIDLTYGEALKFEHFN